MMESVPPGNPVPATNFTQRDINSSRIFYEHTHPFFGLSANDSFSFDARADFAEPLLDQVTSEILSINAFHLDLFLLSQFIRTTVFWKTVSLSIFRWPRR
jgi:chondroitin sulfate proteoglycan 4